MTPPYHDESKPRRRWPIYLAIVIVLLILYPLSIGPAAVFMARGYIGVGLHNALYTPMFCGIFYTGSGEISDSYIEWWLVVTNTPHWS
jgi:hypothetical protein